MRLIRSFILSIFLIKMFLYAICVLLGTQFVLHFPSLPSMGWFTLPFALLATFTFIQPKKVNLCLLSLALGAMLVGYQGHQFLDLRVPHALENIPLEIEATISKCPQFFKQRAVVEVQILKVLKDNQSISWGRNANIQLSWPKPPKSIRVGDTWHFNLKLQRPKYLANPGSFDNETHLFWQHIHGLGRISTKHKPVQLKTASTYSHPIEKARQSFTVILSKKLTNVKYFGIIKALLLGDKGDITSDQWKLFRETGTAHLMAISGLHVGLIAYLGFFLASSLWGVIPIRQTWRIRVPTPYIGQSVGLLVAGCYVLLSGSSVPTIRAFILTCVVMISFVRKIHISWLQSLGIALFIVLLYDPLGSLSPGFWLSFVACGLILWVCHEPMNSKLSKWFKIQCLLLFGLMPFGLFFFQQVSWISPLANAFAIPFASWFIVPLIFAGGILLGVDSQVSVWVFQWADQGIEWLIKLLAQLSEYKLFWEHGLPEGKTIIFGFLGLLFLLLPRKWPGRIVGLCCFLPLIFPLYPKVKEGELSFTLLDVGQGLACVIKTKNHTLVYDTGPKGGILTPYLRTQGITSLDKLMISHADLDHVGGAFDLLNNLPVKKIQTSDPVYFQEKGLNKKETKLEICQAGQHWQWDGISFEVLHPSHLFPENIRSKKRNNDSCVLHIQTPNQSILLTGDINKTVEKKLVKQHKERLRSTVLVVAHHGSASSTDELFLKTVQPEYAIIGVGYLNRYQHPRESVLERLRQHKVKIFNTITSGALKTTLKTRNHALIWDEFLIKNKRFWHNAAE